MQARIENNSELPAGEWTILDQSFLTAPLNNAVLAEVLWDKSFFTYCQQVVGFLKHSLYYVPCEFVVKFAKDVDPFGSERNARGWQELKRFRMFLPQLFCHIESIYELIATSFTQHLLNTMEKLNLNKVCHSLL